MTGNLTIRNARIVLPDRVVTGDVVVVDGVIEQIGREVAREAGEVVDGRGLTVLPGLVDTLVDVPLGAGDDGTPLARVSGEAAAWGVTSLLLHDPAAPATSGDDLRARLDHAARHCRVHHGVYGAAWPDRPAAFEASDRLPGLRVVVGEGAGRRGLDAAGLDALLAAQGRLVVVEGEDPEGLATRRELYAGPVDPAEHSAIHAPELSATVVRQVVGVARRRGARVHLARVSTAAELEALRDAGDVVTVQATAPHLFLRAPEAYARLGVRAVAAPPLRDGADVRALWAAVAEGRVHSVASGHGSIRLADKEQPYPRTPTPLPTVGALLPLLLHRVHEGRLTLTEVARLVAEAPARIFGLARTGRIEVGFDADLVVVDAEADVSATPPVPSWSGWSPFDGFQLRGRPVMTLLRGRTVYRDGRLVDGVRGRELTYHRA